VLLQNFVFSGTWCLQCVLWSVSRVRSCHLKLVYWCCVLLLSFSSFGSWVKNVRLRWLLLFQLFIFKYTNFCDQCVFICCREVWPSLCKVAIHNIHIVPQWLRASCGIVNSNSVEKNCYGETTDLLVKYPDEGALIVWNHDHYATMRSCSLFLVCWCVSPIACSVAGKENIQVAPPNWRPGLNGTDLAVFMAPYPYNCGLKVEGVVVSGHPLGVREPHLLANAHANVPRQMYHLRYTGQCFFVSVATYRWPTVDLPLKGLDFSIYWNLPLSTVEG
jgi:hypothetical protein